MSNSRWKEIRNRIGETWDWLVILTPGVLVGYVVYRWLDWTVVDSFYAGVLAIPVVGFLVMLFQFKRDTEVIGEVVDPDFGELTKYRDSWLAVLELEAPEEPLFLRGAGTQEPTVMQRSSVIEIVDSWSQWVKGLEAALDRMKKDVPEKPWELFIVDIALDGYEPEWEVSIVVSKGEVDYDFVVKFREGKLVELKKDDI